LVSGISTRSEGEEGRSLVSSTLFSTSHLASNDYFQSSGLRLGWKPDNQSHSQDASD